MKRAVVLLCVVLLVFFAWASAQEKKVEKKTEAKTEMKTEAKAEMKGDPAHAVKESVMRGKALFGDASLGTSGMSCNSCHVKGGTEAGKMGEKEIPPFKNIAMKYPGYFKMADKVMTLDQVINFCIVTPMKGKALAWDDQRIADLAAFVTHVEGMKAKMGESMKEEKKGEKEKGK